MKKVFISFLVICCCFSFGFSQNKSSKFVGAYQWCPFPCQTIKLNSDFTFDYLLDGDLFNNERNIGFWHFIGKDKIYLQTIENAPLVKVDEQTGKDNPFVKIQVVDLGGAAFNNFEIRVNGTKYLTNENGICEIPNTQQFSFSYGKRNYLYYIKNNNLEAIYNVR